MKQIITNTGILQVVDNCVVIAPHGEDVKYDVAQVAIHGPNKPAPAKQHLVLLNINEFKDATEIARKELAGTDEFPDAKDIFAAPVYCGGYTVDGVMYYSV